MALERLPRIAVLASGRGSNFSAIAKAVGEKKLAADIVLVGSDRADAAVLEKAQDLGLKTLVEKDQARLAAALRELQVDYVVLAGFMRILKAEFIAAFQDARGFARIINIHPSLLPELPGLDSYKRAFEQKLPKTGVTVHFVDAGVDTGPICAQESFSIADCTSVEEVEKRGLAIEHALYPRTLSWILANQFEILKQGERFYVRPH
ncbi:MAG: phosphoribosylglycinamide formyltransferase [Bdellovibrionales bacterium]|nr:phosphoribosylglycinamide formyltransferase [Bdellovibrionales bacterium]